MTDSFGATNTVMSPFTITNAQFTLVVSTINIDSQGNTKVRATRPTATPTTRPGRR